jgi:Ser/Thr protein kinase RdoA (MazF antagonist)
VYADIPLTSQVVQAVADRYGIDPAAAGVRRLYGGEESAAYQVGDHVIRIGPTWRRDDQAEWCHAVAAHAAATAPEFLAPRRSRHGQTVIRVAGRPVTVWPFVAGVWADDRDRAHRRQAAELLARLHAALATAPVGPPPVPPSRAQVPPEVADAELDAWLAEFDQQHRPWHPLHGDYYAGNTLADGDRIVAVLDWDEARLGPPQREAAHAAWEWGDGLAGGKLDGAHEFLESYAAAGGPGADLDETALRQLIRERLRSEVRWAHAAPGRGVTLDPDDQAYTRAQVAAFWKLRPAGLTSAGGPALPADRGPKRPLGDRAGPQGQVQGGRWREQPPSACLVRGRQRV